MNKTVKKIMSVILATSVVLPLAACGKKIEPVKAKDFKKALEESLDIDDDEYYDWDDEDDENIWYSDSNIVIDFYIYEDEDDAYDLFEDLYDEYQDMMDDKDFSGKSKAVFTDTYGYITLNGEADTKHWLDDDIYGGIYYAGDMVAYIYTTSTKDAKKETIDDLLGELGFPKP